MSDQIYLDYNASTPVEPEVVEKMIPYFLEEFGNPSNKSHPFGWVADEAANIAREQLAALIGANPEEIYFTGGASEAVNTAIKGIASAYAGKGKHIITGATEHRAVLESCRSLRPGGFQITELPVDKNGQVSPDVLQAALREDTILVALMWANNETGVLHPMEEIKEVMRNHPALLMTDATQAVGKVPVDVHGIDLLACSGHKMYGPKGVGALYIRQSSPPIRCTPLIHGGNHESGMRAGTLNVPGIVGFGVAAAIAADVMEKDRTRLVGLRDDFESALLKKIPGTVVNSARAERLPQTSNITFPIKDASVMMRELGSAAVSTGSSCATGRGTASHVLLSQGLTVAQAAGTIRFSFGRKTTQDELDRVVEGIAAYCKAHSHRREPEAELSGEIAH